MKIAIVHDTLVVRGGAEIMLEQLLKIFPSADLFTLIRTLSDEEFPALAGRTVTTSFIQRLPFSKSKYRGYLALMPIAIEQFDLSEYDLVISSTFAVAKGIITGPDQVHISYVHSPVRYAWDLYHSYLNEAKLVRGIKATIAKLILHYIRIWDLRTANAVDAYIANSDFIARRIWKFYRRKSYIVTPPVSLNDFQIRSKQEDYYFVTARMVPYKLIPLIVKSFRLMPSRKLIVAGDGPEMKKAKAEAGPNVEFVGFVERKELIDLMSGAKAFVYAAKEDFGIVMAEAQSCGVPVIAFGEGGALDVVVDGKTGKLFYKQTTESIIKAVETFESMGVSMSAVEIRNHAEKFSEENFRNRIMKIIDFEIQKKISSKQYIEAELN